MAEISKLGCSQMPLTQMLPSGKIRLDAFDPAFFGSGRSAE